MFYMEANLAPDWQAINAAHRTSEQLGYVSPNARPIGSVAIDQAYPAHDLHFVVPIPEDPGLSILSRKSNGYGGRGKTQRSQPTFTTEDSPRHLPLNEQLSKLAGLGEQVSNEIANPKRVFFRTVEDINDDGRTYLRRIPINDILEEASLRSRERIALEKVLDALRVDIFEKHPRMRGYPSPYRIMTDEATFHNVAYLKSSVSEESKDPILQAILEDLEERLKAPPLTEEEKERQEYYGIHPKWQDELYSPFLDYLRF